MLKSLTLRKIGISQDASEEALRILRADLLSEIENRALSLTSKGVFLTRPMRWCFTGDMPEE